MAENSDPARTKFDSWCILEIMGHARYAGRVTEEQIGGASFIRIDVPYVGEGNRSFTKFFSPGSIFSITPCEEDTARAAAKAFRCEPYAVFDMKNWTAPERQLAYREQDLWDEGRIQDQF